MNVFKELCFFYKPNTDVIALPSWKNPKVCFEKGTIKDNWTRSNLVAKLYIAKTIKGVTYRFLKRALLLVGISNTKKIICDSYVLSQYLKGILPEFNEVIIFVGNSEVSHRLILQIMNNKKEIIGYLKYGFNQQSIVELDREYYILSNIQSSRVPNILKFDKLGNGKALLTEDIQGNEIIPDELINMAVIQLIEIELQKNREQKFYAIDKHPWILKNMNGYADIFSTLYSEVFEIFKNRKWPTVLLHGDLHPRNVIQDNFGEIKIIDWERGDLQGFPYIDTIFYLISVKIYYEKLNNREVYNYICEYLVNNYDLSQKEANVLIKMVVYYQYIDCKENGLEDNHKDQQWKLEILNV